MRAADRARGARLRRCGCGCSRALSRCLRLVLSSGCEGCEKLSAHERYRVRQGRYRILYTISDEEVIVVVVKVGHRRDVYR